MTVCSPTTPRSKRNWRAYWRKAGRPRTGTPQDSSSPPDPMSYRRFRESCNAVRNLQRWHSGIQQRLRRCALSRESTSLRTSLAQSAAPVFFPMLPGGTSVHWHQDNHFFGTASPHIVSCAVYLEPTDVQNGSLKIVPGSHLEGEVPHCPGKGEWANGEWAEVDEDRAVDVVCTAGTVVLFNALLLHAAHKNTSLNRSRFSVFCHFVPSDLNFTWGEIDFSAGQYSDRYPMAC